MPIDQEQEMARTGLSRRRVLATAAAAATLSAPFVRGAHAAGKLAVGFWDHWVPGANDTLRKLAQQWADKEKIDLAVDFITSTGDKLRITTAAEAQAGSGHDALAMPTWLPASYADKLEPVDDVVQALLQQNGSVSQTVEYLGKANSKWVAVPTCVGTQSKPPCGRIDLLKQFVGLDVTQMYPAGRAPDKELADKWTWDFFLQAAEKCAKGGYPFGMPLGASSDAVDWVGAVFASHGATLVDEKGEITVKSDATRQVLEWFTRLVPSLPPDVFAWDDASNNKILISGRSALIMNPPSAWAVAKRDAPKIAEQLWTFPAPKGPKGRYEPFLPYYWTIWSFSQNKPAAKSLLAYLSQRDAVEQLVAASQGYDIPPYDKLRDFKVWAEQAPPPGTIYNYPPREPDRIPSIAAAPAPPNIAVQIYTQATMTKMIAHCTQGGESIDQAIAWAADELDGFMRG
jgi:ABC-type glycerol-3-phosphate transport system substrate-binding protein